MKSLEGDQWEASYWDDILHEFGEQAYVEMRYNGGSERIGLAELARHFGDVLDRAYGPEWRKSTMEFNVNVTGTKRVEVYTSDLQDELVERAEALAGDDLTVLDDWTVEDADIDSDTIEVALKFSGTTTVEVDVEDLRQLVERQVADRLGSDIEDIELDIEEA